MTLIDLDRQASGRRGTAGRPARAAVALGAVAALVMLPGDRPLPGVPRPAPECSVFEFSGPAEGVTRAMVVDVETGRVLDEVPAPVTDGNAVFAMACPD